MEKMENWNKLKIKIFEGIEPKYYHGKCFAMLESDLEQGFLRGYVEDYIFAFDKRHNQVPVNPCIHLTRDRKKYGKLISGLEQAKIFSERDNEGIIYVFNSDIINLKGYEDNGERNVIVREPINLHKFLEKIVVNSKIENTYDKTKELLSKMDYPGIKVEKITKI